MCGEPARRVDNHSLLSKYVRCLTTADLIPAQYRPAGIDQPLRSALTSMMAAWDEYEFVLEPVPDHAVHGQTGIDGDTFKRAHLMDRYGVQVNKTSRNTVLFMTHIGTTRSSVAYLIEVLMGIIRDLDDNLIEQGSRERAAHQAAAGKLTVPRACPYRTLAGSTTHSAAHPTHRIRKGTCGGQFSPSTTSACATTSDPLRSLDASDWARGPADLASVLAELIDESGP